MSNIKQKCIVKLTKPMRDQIESGLLLHGKVKVVGLGIFETKEVPARRGRNPQTSEIVMMPSYTRLKFRPTKALREVVYPR